MRRGNCACQSIRTRHKMPTFSALQWRKGRRALVVTTAESSSSPLVLSPLLCVRMFFLSAGMNLNEWQTCSERVKCFAGLALPCFTRNQRCLAGLIKPWKKSSPLAFHIAFLACHVFYLTLVECQRQQGIY